MERNLFELLKNLRKTGVDCNIQAVIKLYLRKSAGLLVFFFRIGIFLKTTPNGKVQNHYTGMTQQIVFYSHYNVSYFFLVP